MQKSCRYRIGAYSFLTTLFTAYLFILSSHAFSPRSSDAPRFTTTALSASLKPAAAPLMAAGKALATSGERLIEWTADNELYGGALSAAGANIRNAGDSVAQAAASCRFKTGRELVTDELREAGTCLSEAVGKLQQAVEEAGVDKDASLAAEVEITIEPVSVCAISLEEAGAAILKGGSAVDVGQRLVAAGQALEDVQWAQGTISCSSFSQQAIRAGESLQGIAPKPSGRSFLKPYSVE